MGHPAKTLRLILALFSLALASSASARDVTITLPVTDTIVATQLLRVSGYFETQDSSTTKLTLKHLASASVEEYDLTLSGGGRIFYAEVELREGLNDILVGDAVASVFLDNGKGGADKRFRKYQYHDAVENCGECHSIWDGELALNDGMPGLCTRCHEVGVSSELTSYQINEHSEKVTLFCVGCHRPHGSEENHLLKRGTRLTCLKCHQQLDTKSSHAGKEGRDCATCHDPHQSVYEYMLKWQEPQKVCLNCHEDVFIRSYESRSQHRPVARKECGRCHSSHGGELPFNLKDEEPALCMDCHALPELHVKELSSCSACHNPHQAKERSLVEPSGSDLCLDCHRNFKGREFHGEGSNVGCLKCHDPHKMIDDISTSVCGECHQLTSSDFKAIHEGLPMDIAEQCSYCHNPHGGDGEGNFYGTLHYPVDNGGCLVCHIVKGGALELRYEKSETCYRCHGETVGVSSVVREDIVHSPVAEDACTACHDPHVKQRNKMLLLEVGELCRWCHGDEMVSKGVLHGALEDGGCTDCHRPHISESKPLLEEPQPELCITCHDDVFDGDPRQNPLVHGALKEGRCSGCHDPHSEENTSLISGGENGACNKCHPEVLKDEDGAPWPNLHGPVAAGECVACHTLGHLHDKSLEDKFLPVTAPEDICLECHDTDKEHIPSRVLSRERRKPWECLACHYPHGAKNALMLKKMNY
ncbi:MAG: hypothetical protein C0608_07105 [Deltaproteobacteria bacterium]|nr:MAG: hypothetical protein C0608_07105 [Deltaproteobacteria bacterium]